MNLPEINEREHVVQEASLDFNTLCQEAFRIYAVKLDLGQVIKAYNQIIVNLLSKTKETHNDFQQEVERALESLGHKYQLTLGEQMLLITDKSKRNIDNLISWERKE